MATDKAQLLQYFQAHYLSRREVLFKLPLSISIDTFWSELLNQRKARAQVLPLYNAVGKPYWYVLTDKMIAASERLCEEAMNQDERFDPYRAPMTSAMTEEMFFTSFVEGAQIPLQEAMDFLQRGTEPEDVQEQMIWNNRQAWSSMVKVLFKPLDETFVKSLAFMLTDEMEGRADDYRQMDGHPIAAMYGEPYEVPRALHLPERMREFYDFLRNPELHPLIKAAVGQAFLLVTRPFSEGNERLSRMISTAVLLRSGYDFFRDISVSSLIARESYRYYKAMCEILRTENGDDLTYFIEYYLDLLARALDTKKERDRRREEERERESLERERELSQQPLRDVPLAVLPSGILPSSAVLPSAYAQEAQGEQVFVSTLQPHVEPTQHLPPVQQEIVATESPPRDTPYDEEQLRCFLDVLSGFSYRSTVRKTRVANMLRQYIERGVVSFTRQQWQDEAGISQDMAMDDCTSMLNKGLTVSRGAFKNVVYWLTCVRNVANRGVAANPKTVANKKTATKPQAETVDSYSSIRSTLMELERVGTVPDKRISTTILSMLDSGIYEFTTRDWAACLNCSDYTNKDNLHRAIILGLITPTDNGYQIYKNIDQYSRFDSLPPKLYGALNLLCENYSGKTFTVSEASILLSSNGYSTNYSLKQLRERGIVRFERIGRHTFSYSFTADFMQRQQRRVSSVSSAGVSSAPPASASTTKSHTGMVAAQQYSQAMGL